ncbi:MAG: sodium:solute symporter family protein [Candidatus Brocadiaceae bacterium]|jgi:SSS family solute:Na+ symporter
MELYEILVVVVYLLAVGYLGYRGWRRTQTAADYLVAGRSIHPFVMALSYGATFISTSAIVGFGGVAGLFGMSLLWLTFLNIFVGIFIAFVFLGGPTRKMGHHLDAHTFPELLGRRYNSKFIQVFAGLIIFFFIPLYAAVVLIGGCEFIATKFGIPYEVAVFVFSVIIAVYVVVGGLKGVMYTDALQGSIMFLGMVILLVFTYVKLGGVTDAHRELTSLSDLVPGNLAAIGHRGWTRIPPFGWGELKYDLWWIVVSTITMGVGIGVLAQPQLVVRFMTVRSKKQLNRAVLVGGVFILIMTGVAFTVGSTSNAYFAHYGKPFTGTIAKMVDQQEGHAVLHLVGRNAEGQWKHLYGEDGEPKMVPVLLDKDAPYLKGTMAQGEQQLRIARGRSISIVYAKKNPDQIIPTYITQAMPAWFGLLFLLTLLAAAMSTLSSQFHALGTSIGRDVYEQFTGAHEKSITITRVGIIIGIVIAVTISYTSRGGYIIARGTAIFFGLCASAFLPAYVGGLFWKRATRTGAIASMVVGFTVSGLWLLLVKAKEAGAIGLVQIVTGGKTSILAGHHNWPVVDPLVVALPLSVIAMVVVSLLTRPMDSGHVDYCFGGAKPEAD